MTGVAYDYSIAWGDYDDDGDLDLALGGYWYDGSSHCEGKVCRNDGGVFNTPPSAPSNLSATVVARDVIFSWAAATDAKTPQPGLTYNIRVGTTSGGDEIMPGMALVGGTEDGKRLAAATGNVQHNLSWTVHIAYRSSAWAETQVVVAQR